MLTEKEIYKKIRRLQIVSTQLASDILAGAYKSAFKGKGVEFEDVRVYQAGDDVRTIDWNVTARLGHPHVKNFKEERSLTVMLVVDVSRSTYFGTTDASKKELIAEIGALLAFTAIQNGDKIGLILFSNQIEKYLPPKRGVKHVLRIIRELLAYQSLHKGTDVGSALSFLGKVQRKRGICFLLSDFLCTDYYHPASLIAKSHDLIALCLTDSCEINIPSLGIVNLSDLESEEMQFISTESPELRQNFKKLANERITFHKKTLEKMGADFVDIRTETPYLPTLQQFFKRRRKQH